MSLPLALALTAGLLAANAFFVGAEFALISARRSQIEPRAQQGSRLARTTLRAMEDISLVLAGAQLGITVCSLALGAVSEPAIAYFMEPYFEAWGVPENLVHPIALVIALSLVVYLHVVLGEMVPKNIAIAGPERSALVLGPPMWAVLSVLRPVIAALNAVANLILRAIRVEPQDEVSSTYTREEVAALVEESRGEGLIEPDEYNRLAGALGFTERAVSAVLMPSSDLTTLPSTATIADVEARCAATGFSRFPVMEGGRLIGYLHIKDVLVTDEERRSDRIAREWIRPFAQVRADTLLHDALETLQRRGAHMAVVTDADDAALGVVMLEDVIEELVGEIRDAAHLDDVG